MKKYKVLGPAAMILSKHSKRERIPDESTPAERAEWIGQEGTIKGQPIVYIDAIKRQGVWYVQYVESQPPAPGRTPAKGVNDEQAGT